MDTRDTAPLEAHLADRVKALRSEFGWSQQQVADRSGIPKHAVTAIEKFERRITLEDVAALCVAFGVGLDNLLAGDDGDAGPNGDALFTADAPAADSALLARLTAVEARLAALEAAR